jgi:hypothetical protein
MKDEEGAGERESGRAGDVTGNSLHGGVERVRNSVEKYR